MMRFFARPAVGLVIRTEAIEVIRLLRSAGGVNVLDAIRVPVAQSPPAAGGKPEGSNETAAEDARVVAAIQQALSAAKLATRRMAVAIPSNEVLLRAFTMPSIPKAEMENTVQFEVRQYLPFKISDLVWDYAATARPDRQTNVIFTGMERSAFGRVQEWLKAAGVQPTRIEPHSVSLARAVQLSERSPRQEFVAVLDIRPSAVQIALVKDGLPYLARHVALGASGEGSPETAATLLLAERVLSELRVSMDFFTREFPGAAIGRVVLFGDGPVAANWCQQFAPHLGCPVEAGRLPVTGHLAPETPASFASAVGAACADGRGSDAKYRTAAPNFLARNQKSMAAAAGGQWNIKELASRSSLRALNRSVLGGVATVSIVLLCALWLFGARQVRSAQQELELSAENRPDVGWGLTGRTQADLEGIGQLARERLAFLRRVIEGRISVAGRLDALVRSLPEGIWLAGLQYDDQLRQQGEGSPRLTLEGACFLGEGGQEVPVIQQFEERTKRDGHFYRGFAASQLGEIAEHANEEQAYSYKTFRLEYSPDRRL